MSLDIKFDFLESINETHQIPKVLKECLILCGADFLEGEYWNTKYHRNIQFGNVYHGISLCTSKGRYAIELNSILNFISRVSSKY